MTQTQYEMQDRAGQVAAALGRAQQGKEFPFCQWPRCECSPPDCERDDAHMKHLADAQDCLDQDMGR